MSVKILIYEDNELLRESLSSLLSLNARFESIIAFSNVLTVKDDVITYQPDIVLMDIDMPQRSGIEAVKLIRLQNHTIPIIMLTVFDDNENVLKAIYAGASGYLLKKDITSKLFFGNR